MMMVNDELSEHKPGRFVLPGNRIRFISPFLFSVISGMIYTWLIVNETTNGYLGTLLPSTSVADLHQYLPVILPSFLFSYVVQRKHMILIENISFSCIQAMIAILSLFVSLIAVMVFM
ncbi:hypothetical protein NKT34_01920 [Paenibacillus polysaccharolyticus]|uniref:hypothetical protein n=2 Tax=Paenibacillus TaxID=44249 RepID=UPI0012B7DDF9|nr:hypothetical protein [Paenibacillus polysaccharolyticus]MCP1132041.1 hypothetical protein [Paenibacillus polysaccharolyticus]MDP9701131.1 hypothetical protein [Paenibacillus intestini]